MIIITLIASPRPQKTRNISGCARNSPELVGRVAGRGAGRHPAGCQVVVDLEANEEPVPRPFATRSYSGKFMVRVPPEVHRRLIIEAAEAGVSSNRLASAKLGN